jgi:phosphate starvation-inducible PhoH-like protein
MAKRRAAAKQEAVVEEPKPAMKFLNESQRHAWGLMETKPITMLLGFAGSGKTHTALAYASHAIDAKKYSELVVVRSPLEAGRSRIGYLKGDATEKMAPYAAPIFDICRKLKFTHPVKVIPPCFIQGMTFSDSVIVVDECQNLTVAELVAVVTRMDRNSQMIMCGDPEQDTRDSNGLIPFLNSVRNLECVGVQEFTVLDNARHPAIAEVVTALRRDKLI